VLLNQGVIRAMIKEGNVKEIRDYIARSRDMGMQTFEQAIIDLYTKNLITEDVAMAESDNPADVRLAIQQHEMGRRMQAARANERFKAQDEF
jgi:twitching motility protein PilU